MGPEGLTAENHDRFDWLISKSIWERLRRATLGCREQSGTWRKQQSQMGECNLASWLPMNYLPNAANQLKATSKIGAEKLSVELLWTEATELRGGVLWKDAFYCNDQCQTRARRHIRGHPPPLTAD